MTTKARWTVQTSEGTSSRTRPSIGMVIERRARLTCQINPTTGDEHAISLSIGYDGTMAFHGSLADLRRMVELLRTTLGEYGDGPNP